MDIPDIPEEIRQATAPQLPGNEKTTNPRRDRFTKSRSNTTRSRGHRTREITGLDVRRRNTLGGGTCAMAKGRTAPADRRGSTVHCVDMRSLRRLQSGRKAMQDMPLRSEHGGYGDLQQGSISNGTLPAKQMVRNFTEGNKDNEENKENLSSLRSLLLNNFRTEKHLAISRKSVKINS